jgi:pimeloyl-ACP methyl ester carboxylesterase
MFKHRGVLQPVTGLNVDDSIYPDDQLILTCLPSHFDGTLIVYAHGYVRPQAALSPPAELGNASVQEFVEQLLDLGFGFATSSYRKNGYAVEQAEVDLNDLVDYVEAIEPDVDAVYVIGASEGGLIATMLVEKYPQTYAGGLALCGPLAGVGGRQ